MRYPLCPRIFYILLSVLLLSSIGTAYAAGKAGLVLIAKGTVSAVSRGQSRALTRRAEFYVRESINTGSESSAQLRFNDGTLVTVGQNSTFRVEDYSFNDKTGAGRNVSSLVSGSLRSLTGKINSANQSAYELKTPVTSIGIRGTDFILATTRTITVVIVDSGAVIFGGMAVGPDETNRAAMMQLGQSPVGISAAQAKAMIAEMSRHRGVSLDLGGRQRTAVDTIQDAVVGGDFALENAPLVYFDTAADLTGGALGAVMGFYTTPITFMASNDTGTGFNTGTAASPVLINGSVTFSSGSATALTTIDTLGSGSIPSGSGISWTAWDTTSGDWLRNGAAILTSLAPNDVFSLNVERATPFASVPQSGSFSYTNVAYRATDGQSGVAAPATFTLNLNVDFSSATFTGNLFMQEGASGSVGQWSASVSSGVMTPVTNSNGETALSFTGSLSGNVVIISGGRTNAAAFGDMTGTFAGTSGQYMTGAFKMRTFATLEAMGGLFINQRA